MEKEEIKKILPHREPMLLIEKAYTEDNKGIGVYKVKGDEFFLQGHFPEKPVVPGVIQCEMMAQSCCILLKDDIQDGKKFTPFFTGLNNVKFKNPILPNDEIKIICEITRKKFPFYFAKAEVYVKDKLCSQGELSFAIIKEKDSL